MWEEMTFELGLEGRSPVLLDKGWRRKAGASGTARERVKKEGLWNLWMVSGTRMRACLV